jgi:CAAX protease family protein
MGSFLVAWAKRHPLAAYFLLACAITWVVALPLVSDGLRLTHWRIPAGWHALGAVGPITAAVIMTAVVGGREGLRRLAARMGQWRVGWRWALIAMLSPFAMFALTVVMLRLVGLSWPDWSLLGRYFGESSWLLGALLAAAVYGVGEEPGWRGFALPYLQRSWSPLPAALAVGGLWALWHLPFFTYRYHLGGIDLVFFVLGILAGSIWLTYLYNATGGSVLMVMGWHTSWNVVNVAAAVLSGPLVASLTVEVIVAALVIALVWKLSHRAPGSRLTRAADGATTTTQTTRLPTTPVGAS